MRPVAVVEEALAEARAAYKVLEDARPGLASAFAASLRDVFSRLEQHPWLGAPTDLGAETRRLKLARFPYSVIYEVTDYWRSRT